MWMQIWLWATFVIGVGLGCLFLQMFIKSKDGTLKCKLSKIAFATTVVLFLVSLAVRYAVVFGSIGR